MILEEIKTFLRVDFEEDDEYITLLMDVAKEYIENAVGVFNEKRALMKLLFLAIVSNLYENRQYTIDKSNEKVAHIVKSMVLQLQLEQGENIE